VTPFIERYDEYLDERYYYAKHPSGLDIYVFPKDFAVSYGLLTVKYGSFDNRFATKGTTAAFVPEGIAHFLEHKMFDNEDGSDTFEKFAEMGAYCNAYTTFDRTAYMFSSTERHKECLSELLSFVFSPYFTEKTVEKEKGIIAEEIKMGLDNPSARGFHLLTSLLYSEHPVSHEVAGTEESVNKIDVSMIKRCYDTFYTPSNMILALSGDFSPEEAYTLCTKRLPKLPAREIMRFESGEGRAVREKRGYETAGVSRPIFYVGFKDDFSSKKGEKAIRRSVASSILCELLFGETSPFYTKMLESGLADKVSASYLLCRDIGFSYITGYCDEPETVYTEIMNAVRDMKRTGIDEGAFMRQKKSMISDFVRAFNSTEEICEAACDCALYDCDVFDYADILRRIGTEELEFLLCELYDERYAAMSVVASSENLKGEEICTK